VRSEADATNVLRAAGEPYSAVSLCISEARALADTLQTSTESAEPDPESITAQAGMIFNRMHEARKHLEALWVAIGGKA
jgi:hypothetical protein